MGLRKQRNLEAAREEIHAAFLEAVKGFKRRKDIGVVAIGIIFRRHLETAVPWSRLSLCCVIKERSVSSFSTGLLSSATLRRTAEEREGKKEKQTNIIKKLFVKSSIDPLSLNFCT